MRILLVGASLIFILITNGCNKENNTLPHLWMNLAYVHCLKNDLPCACEEKTNTYFSIEIDTTSKDLKNAIAIMKYDQLEPYQYDLKKNGRTFVVQNNTDSIPIGVLLIKHDTLILKTSSNNLTFVPSKSSDLKNAFPYAKENLRLLNIAFKERGYPSLEKILDKDELQCNCNKPLGKVNLISIKGVPDSWILERSGDSLYIDRISNVSRDPDDALIRERILRLKW